MAQVRQEMRKRGVPRELSNRCILYYDYVWRHHRVFDIGTKTLSDLSPTLANEVNVFTHRVSLLRGFSLCTTIPIRN
jgi:hypothetical protein